MSEKVLPRPCNGPLYFLDKVDEEYRGWQSLDALVKQYLEGRELGTEDAITAFQCAK